MPFVDRLELEVEQRLRETESRFRVMADCAPVLLWMSRSDALCEFFNEVWLQFTGRSQEEEWGVGWTEGVHPEDFQYCVDTYMTAFRARNPFSMEYRLRRHDGEYRWILDRGVPRYSPDGEFRGYIGSCIDITDRKVAEQERVGLIVKLEDALRVREEFMAIASHELRTPLTPLKLQLQILRRYLARKLPSFSGEESLGAILDTTVQQVERLTKLVDDLLDVSRINSGKLTVDCHEMDLAKLVREVIGKFSAQIKACKAPVEVIGDQSVTGNWDSFRLEQVITNLLSNALKYGAGKPIKVFVSTLGRNARLVIQDQGIGISKEDQERIFNRFERAVSYKSFGGLGLGLYISKQIITLHGGGLSVESEPGKGATFTLEIPGAGG